MIKKYENHIARKVIGLLLVLVAVVFIFLFPARTYAETQQVYDNASMLSENEISVLSEAVGRLEDKTGWDLVLLTVDDSSVSSSQDYAEEQFIQLADSENGAALLLDMYNRQIYIATSGEAITYLTDARIDSILDDAYEYASGEEYGEMFQIMVSDISRYYDDGVVKGHGTYNTDTGEYTADGQSGERGLTAGNVVVAVIAGVIGCAVFCIIIVGRYRLKFHTYKYSPFEHGHVEVHHRQDLLVHKHVTTRKIPKNPPPNSGNTSSVHTGAGGNTFGGGGRSF